MEDRKLWKPHGAPFTADLKNDPMTLCLSDPTTKTGTAT
jgi:hypothetical protein